MKAEFESQDIEAIAQRLKELLLPIITSNNGHGEDIIFTPESLAEFLKVDISWVYKKVSSKNIPFFKSGKYVRFKKSSIDRWINSQENLITHIKRYIG